MHERTGIRCPQLGSSPGNRHDRYDLFSQQLTTLTPTNAIESYAYDPQGNVVSFWNPLRYGDPDPNE